MQSNKIKNRIKKVSAMRSFKINNNFTYRRRGMFSKIFNYSSS